MQTPTLSFSFDVLLMGNRRCLKVSGFFAHTSLMQAAYETIYPYCPLL